MENSYLCYNQIIEMCKLNFEYQITNVPEEMKIEFEERVNKNWALGCETIKKADGVVMVNWAGNPQRLRGLLFMDAEAAKQLPLDFKKEIF
jgi:hypothetical protein